MKNNTGIYESYIIGCVVYSYKKASNKYMRFSFKNLFKERKSIYIMTIGTINEFRGKGLSSLFIDFLK